MGIGMSTLPPSKTYITLQLALCVCSSATVNSANCGSYVLQSTFNEKKKKKKLCVSSPIQSRCMLFKDQLYLKKKKFYFLLASIVTNEKSTIIQIGVSP